MFPPDALTAFLLILARLGGVLIFVPMPGAKGAPAPARAVLVVSLSVVMLPMLPQFTAFPSGLGQLVIWLVGEMLLGVTAGVMVAMLSESLVFGLQTIAIQAGFSYSSTIDPNSEADSSVLQVLAQIAANLLFLQLGGDAMVVRAFARSFESWPPGGVELGQSAATMVIGFGSSMLELGFRLALPIAALLLLADLSMALMGRMQSQLQLLTLAFPVKMLGTLAFLTLLLPVIPLLYRSALQQAAMNLSRLMR